MYSDFVSVLRLRVAASGAGGSFPTWTAISMAFRLPLNLLTLPRLPLAGRPKHRMRDFHLRSSRPSSSRGHSAAASIHFAAPGIAQCAVLCRTRVARRLVGRVSHVWLSLFCRRSRTTLDPVQPAHMAIRTLALLCMWKESGGRTLAGTHAGSQGNLIVHPGRAGGKRKAESTPSST